MKKLIALVSFCLSFGFALALANTEDSAMNRDSGTESSDANDQANQQGGSAGISGENNPQNPGTNMQGDTGSMSDPKMSDSRMPKTCTDDKGAILRPGQKGFKECTHLEKNKHPEQMGGTSEGNNETTHQSKETYRTHASPSPTNR